MASEEEYDRDEEKNEDDDGDNRGAGLILAILFLPAIIVGFIIYGMLRFGRFKRSLIFSIVIPIQLLSGFILFLMDPVKIVTNLINNYSQVLDNWSQLVIPSLLLSIFIGGFIGLFLVNWEINKMKKNPHLRVTSGTWMYNFKFRRTPWELSQKKKLISELKEGTLQSPERSPLGLNEELEDGYNIAYRYAEESNKHTLISGNAGSGKSVTLMSLIMNDIKCGTSCIIIDMKRDPNFASKVSKWCHENNSHFYHFVNGDPEDYDIPYSSGQSSYDPLRSGSPTTKADMVLNMREYDTASDVYRTSMAQLLQVLFNMLKHADKSKAPNIDWNHGGIAELASAVSGNNIFDLVKACEGKEKEKEANEIAEQLLISRSQLSHSLEELRGQLRTITASEYGRWMKTSPKEKSIDIFNLTKKDGAVIMFSLNSDSEPDFARFVGSMIMSDLTATSAARRNANLKNQVNVYIDEFQAINPNSVAALLEKSRASKMAMTLAQQSFEQIVTAAKNNGEAYLTSLLDTCSNFIVHAGMTEDSATRLSKILGKHEVESYRTSNKNQNFFLKVNWANKRNQTVQTFKEVKWKFDPSEFMSLSSPDPNNNWKSTAVVINKTCTDPEYKKHNGPLARKIWMIPCDEVLQDIYLSRQDNDDKIQKRLSEIETQDTDVYHERVPNKNSSEDESDKTYPVPEDEYSNDTDDGGFSFEKIEEDEEGNQASSESSSNLKNNGSNDDDEDFLNLVNSRELNDNSFVSNRDSVSPIPVKKTVRKKTSSFQAAYEAKKAGNNIQKTEKISEIPKKKSMSSSTGLPISPPPARKHQDIKKDDGEDFTLPLI